MIRTANMVLRDAVKLLAPHIDGDAARECRILLAHSLGIKRHALNGALSQMMTPHAVSQFEALVKRRMAREPISHLTGKRDFWEFEFIVTKDVLDPRPETEILIAAAQESTQPKRILDLGTGSGCILLTLLKLFPNAEGVGVDASVAALDVAGQNAARLDVSDRTQLIASDWFRAVDGQFDLIVSNPPYITETEMEELAPELGFEPQMALTPGGDGLAPYRSLAAGLGAHLSKGGMAFFEHGAAQAVDVAEIFKNAGFSKLTHHTDLDNRQRVLQVTA